MKILFFDCGMGAAGDMLSAALYELLPDQTKVAFIEIMNTLLPGVRVSVEPAKKCSSASRKRTKPRTRVTLTRAKHTSTSMCIITEDRWTKFSVCCHI